MGADGEGSTGISIADMMNRGMMGAKPADTSGGSAPIGLDISLRLIGVAGHGPQDEAFNPGSVNSSLKMENAGLSALDAHAVGGLGSIIQDFISKIAIQGDIHSGENHGNVNSSSNIEGFAGGGHHSDSGNFEGGAAGGGNGGGGGEGGDSQFRAGGSTIEGIPIQVSNDHDFEPPARGASAPRGRAHSDSDDSPGPSR